MKKKIILFMGCIALLTVVDVIALFSQRILKSHHLRKKANPRNNSHQSRRMLMARRDNDIMLNVYKNRLVTMDTELNSSQLELINKVFEDISHEFDYKDQLIDNLQEELDINEKRLREAHDQFNDFMLKTN